MLTTNYTIAEVGITVPYPAKRDAIRHNRGFVDTRGRPDTARGIPELADSSALKALVIALAAPDSRYFSLGCDLGAHEDNEELPCVAGGYLQIAATHFYQVSANEYYRVARFIGAFVDPRSADFCWLLNLECVSVRFQLAGYDEIFPSLQLWFFARARTPQRALIAREALVAAVADAIAVSPSSEMAPTGPVR